MTDWTVDPIPGGPTTVFDLDEGVFNAPVVINDAGGVEVTPGSDIDATLVQVNVTGVPRFWWDESEDAFVLTKRLILDDSATGQELIEMQTGGNSTILVRLPESPVEPAIVWNEVIDAFEFYSPTAGGDVNVIISGYLYLNTVDGIDINPGSDADADLVTVQVTGTPKLYWDESINHFRFTHGVYFDVDIITAGAVTVGTGLTAIGPVNKLQGDAVIGDGFLLTTAIAGFGHIPYCQGAATGTPTYEGAAMGAPIIFDSTNNKIGIYDPDSNGWLWTAALT